MLGGLTVRTVVRSWAVDGAFTISRGSRTEAIVVEVHACCNGKTGRGECVPYPRYDETVSGVQEDIRIAADALNGKVDRNALQNILSPGAARNGLDNALWDLEAKLADKPIHELLGIPLPAPVATAYTISLASIDEMGRKAAENATRPLLKVKLNGEDDLARIKSVHANAPDAKLIIDANEAWSVDTYNTLMPELAENGVALVEQPFHAGEDAILAELEHPVPVCADESCHGLADLPALKGLYDAINIKLDKTGGLTEGYELLKKAKEEGFLVMTGCMLSTSLAMAPALYLAQQADFVDLDGPLLLKEDHPNPIYYEGSLAYPPTTELWG